MGYRVSYTLENHPARNDVRQFALAFWPLRGKDIFRTFIQITLIRNNTFRYDLLPDPLRMSDIFRTTLGKNFGSKQRLSISASFWASALERRIPNVFNGLL